MASIDQTAELNSLLEQQNKLYGEQSKILSQQLRMTQQLVAMQQKMAGNSSGAVSQAEDLGNAINDVANNIDNMDERQSTGFDKLVQNLKDSDNSMARLGVGALNASKAISKWAPAIAAVSGFARGLQVTASGMSSLFQVGSSLVGMFANLGMSILSLPFKLFDAFLQSGTSGGSGFREAIEAARKELGSLSSNEGAAAIKSFRSMRGEVAQTGLSVYRIFGNIAERMQYVNEAIKALGVTFTLVQNQFANNTEALGAYTKGLGLSEEAQRTMAEESIRSGKPMVEIGREMTSQAYQMGEAYGINGKIISRSMGEMATDFDNFGNLGVETLANVAVYARKLGVEVKSLQEVIGKFDNFEDAAKNAANLSQAFGMNVDALGMLNEQDPAARIERLRKSFFAAGKSVEMMTRQERALLATHTGLDQKTASLVFAQKNQSLSYADIQKKGDATKNSQLSQAEAMQKLSSSIERLVKSGSAMTKGFFATFAEGFERGIKRSREWRKSWRTVQRALRVTRRLGMQLGRVFVKAFPGVSQMLKGIQEFFSPQRIKGLIGPINKALKAFFKGDLSFKELFDTIKTQFKDFFDPQGEGVQNFKKGATAFFTRMGEILKAGVVFAMEGLAKGFRFIANWLRTGAMPNLDGASDSMVGWFWTNLLEPLMLFLRGPVAQELWLSFKEMMTLAWGKFKGWAKGFALEHWKLLAGVLLGPAVITSLINSITVAVASSLIKGGSAGLSKGYEGLSKAASHISGKGAGGSATAISSATGAMKETGNLSKATRSVRSSASIIKATGTFLAVAALLTVGMWALIQANRVLGITPVESLEVAAIIMAAGVVAVASAATLQIVQKVGSVSKGVKTGVGGAAAIFITGAALIGALGLMVAAAEAGGITPGNAAGLVVIVAAGGLIVAGLSIVFALLAAVGSVGWAGALLAGGGAIAIFATGAALVGGMWLMIKATSGISMSAIPKLLALVGAGVLIIAGLGLILAELAVTGLVAVFGSWLIGAGAVGVFAAGAILIDTITELISSSEGITLGGIAKVLALVGAGVLIIAGLGLILAELAVTGLLAVFGSWFTGAGAVGVFRAGAVLIDTLTKLISSSEGITLGQVGFVSALLVAGAAIIAALGVILAELTLVGLVSVIANFFDGLLDDGIMGSITTVIKNAIEGLNGINETEIKGAATKLKGASAIIGALAVIGAKLAVAGVTSMYNSFVSFFSEGDIGDMITQLACTITEVTLAMEGINIEDGLEQKLKAVSSIVSIVGVFGTTMADISVDATRGIRRGAGATVPLNAGIQNLTTTMSRIKTSLVGEEGLIPLMLNMLDGITDAKIKAAGAVAPLITAVVSVITAVNESIAAATTESSWLDPTSGGVNLEVLKSMRTHITQSMTVLSVSLLSVSRVLGQINIPQEKAATAGVLAEAMVNMMGLFSNLTADKITKAQAILPKINGFVGHMGISLLIMASTVAGMTDSTIDNVSNSVTAMVASINSVSSGIKSIGNVNLNADLRNLSSRLGLGDTTRLRIESGNLTLNVKVNVVLRVDEIEKALLNSQGGPVFTLSPAQERKGNP